jgi:hypothetical protein
MNIFILILTLSTAHGVTIYSIPGFASADACATAAIKWGADIETRFHSGASAVCVKQDWKQGDRL